MASKEEEFSNMAPWENDHLQIIGDMLDKSMEDYCEEILASGAESKAPGFHFDTI
eukprot:CAMPEP_0196217134 /NCGR_PEP_ID=MMETSP0912-20130531/33746_1 /TAXON_ID=49265 /ORGANISM="Thalassiosira rotula, Strain GSO102" /LENGTH=54 /DNA_ID=CAMNT_0041494499 /DNA_START=33 /DNA_END=197 /DNA_ORIENTATION=-